MPASAYAFIRQAIWVLAGCLWFTEGHTAYELRTGDCLELGAPAACRFENRSQDGPAAVITGLLRRAFCRGIEVAPQAASTRRPVNTTSIGLESSE